MTGNVKAIVFHSGASLSSHDQEIGGLSGLNRPACPFSAKSFTLSIFIGRKTIPFRPKISWTVESIRTTISSGAILIEPTSEAIVADTKTTSISRPPKLRRPDQQCGTVLLGPHSSACSMVGGCVTPAEELTRQLEPGQRAGIF